MMVWGQEKAYWLWRPQTPAMKNTACGFISAAAWWAVRVPWIGSHSSDTVAKPGTDYSLFKGLRDAVHSASNTWHNMMAEEQAQGQPAVQSHCGLGTVGWARTALACVRVIGVGQTQRGWERVPCPPGAEAPCSSVRHCPFWLVTVLLKGRSAVCCPLAVLQREQEGSAGTGVTQAGCLRPSKTGDV